MFERVFPSSSLLHFRGVWLWIDRYSWNRQNRPELQQQTWYFQRVTRTQSQHLLFLWASRSSLSHTSFAPLRSVLQLGAVWFLACHSLPLLDHSISKRLRQKSQIHLSFHNKSLFSPQEVDFSGILFQFRSNQSKIRIMRRKKNFEGRWPFDWFLSTERGYKAGSNCIRTHWG